MKFSRVGAPSTPRALFDLMVSSPKVSVFTGAGISTLSGIPDFRGKGGVYSKDYEGLPVETILSLGFFREHPEIFYSWCSDVWYNLDDYEPNVVHKALAEMQRRGIVDAIFTQNIDMLHQKAGSPDVYEVHGSPRLNRCTECGREYPYGEIAPQVRAGKVPRCAACGGLVKPNIILYGEPLDMTVLEKAEESFSTSDLALVLGSSLTVQPAASMPLLTLQNGGKVVIVNSSPTYLDSRSAMLFSDLGETFSEIERILEENA